MGGEWEFTVNKDFIEDYQKMLLLFESKLDELLPLFEINPIYVKKYLSDNIFLDFNAHHGDETVEFLWDYLPKKGSKSLETWRNLRYVDRDFQKLCLTFQQILHLLGYATLHLNPNGSPYIPCLNYLGDNKWTVCKNFSNNDSESESEPYLIKKSYKIFEYFKILGFDITYCDCIQGCINSDCECHREVKVMKSCKLPEHYDDKFGGWCQICCVVEKYCDSCSKCDKSCKPQCGQ